MKSPMPCANALRQYQITVPGGYEPEVDGEYVRFVARPRPRRLPEEEQGQGGYVRRAGRARARKLDAGAADREAFLAFVRESERNKAEAARVEARRRMRQAALEFEEAGIVVNSQPADDLYAKVRKKLKK